MHNVLLFIKRFLVLIVFLILQGVSITLLSHNNSTYEGIMATLTNEISGGVFSKYNSIESYFTLRETNNNLAEENRKLRSIIYSKYDSSNLQTTKINHLIHDTSDSGKQFHWIMTAKVVNNSVNESNNYITIKCGSEQGVKKDMAVVSTDGIVGIVVSLSKHYSTVMSLLHNHSKVSAALKKNNYSGVIEWEGISPEYLTLKNIPKSAMPGIGDTVLTSSYSGYFPPGLMIGTVAEIQAVQASNNATLKIKCATNFYSLQFVYLVENKELAEQKILESESQKYSDE